MKQHYKLKEEYIELFKLLKLMQLASSGGEAKMFIEQSMVKVNSEIELRKRRKIRLGDLIELDTQSILVE